MTSISSLHASSAAVAILKAGRADTSQSPASATAIILGSVIGADPSAQKAQASLLGILSGLLDKGGKADDNIWANTAPVIKTGKGEINIGHWIELEDDEGEIIVVAFRDAVKIHDQPSVPYG